MSDAIWMFDPRSAIEHIEGNLFGFWTFCGQHKDRVLFDDGHVTWVSSRPYAMPNLIFNLRLDGVDLDRYLSGVVESIRQERCPRVWIRASSDGPPGLYERLAALGFVEIARRPTMAIDLQRLRRPADPLAGLALAPLGGDGELDEWMSIASACFMGGRDMGRDLFARHLLPSPNVRIYLARLDGVAVGTALLFFHGGVAGLHLVGVRESHRRRGIAARLTVHALDDASRLGYRAAVLKASNLGENIYRRLGFQDFSRLILYEWR